MISHGRKTVVFVECSKCFCERISSEREREREREREGVFVLSFFC
jgi:hypothetical protein